MHLQHHRQVRPSNHDRPPVHHQELLQDQPGSWPEGYSHRMVSGNKGPVADTGCLELMGIADECLAVRMLVQHIDLEHLGRGMRGPEVRLRILVVRLDLGMVLDRAESRRLLGGRTDRTAAIDRIAGADRIAAAVVGSPGAAVGCLGRMGCWQEYRSHRMAPESRTVGVRIGYMGQTL